MLAQHTRQLVTYLRWIVESPVRTISALLLPAAVGASLVPQDLDSFIDADTQWRRIRWIVEDVLDLLHEQQYLEFLAWLDRQYPKAADITAEDAMVRDPCEVYPIPDNSPIVLPRFIRKLDDPTERDDSMVNAMIVRLKKPLPQGTGTTPESTNFVRRHGFKANEGRVGYKGDDAGHVLARQLGGKGEPSFLKPNLAPMHRRLNRGSYRDHENAIRRTVDQGRTVCAFFNLIYRGIGGKPHRPDHIYYITWGHQTPKDLFENPLP